MRLYDIFEGFGHTIGILSSTADDTRNANQQPLPVFPVEIGANHAAGGPVFSPPSGDIECKYPSMVNWRHASDATSRQSWLWNEVTGQTFDIHTDFDKKWPEGITRNYTLTVTDAWINADGYNKTDGKVFDGQYPGPWIEACWGDTLRITVINKLKWNGTTIHWHGLRQLHSMEMDGVNGVTQCPIAPGDNFTYTFKATQYGTSWYHSHYSLQYPDGLAGPLTIHGPSSANYDEPVKPFLISDWSHKSAFHDWGKLLQGGGGPPFMQSNIMNGVGSYVNDSPDRRTLPAPPKFSKVYERGKKYLLRLINTSTDATFIFSIDNHTITVIGADFVPILPYKTDSVLIGIGQRYHVIVEANPKDADAHPVDDQNYWIRTVLSEPGCGKISQKTETVGTIRYSNSSTAAQKSARTERGCYPIKCSDEPYRKLFPVVPWIVDKPSNNITNDIYAAALTKKGDKQSMRHGGFQRWDLTDDPLWLDFGKPTINYLANTTWDPEYCIVAQDFKSTDWVYLIVTWNIPNPKDKQKDKFFIPVAHPIHLHGHDFAIIAQEEQPFKEEHIETIFQYNNPPRRDVALLPEGGYVAIAFRTDNPGAWLLHCHIAWHASSGLALQILERQKEIVSSIGDLAETQRVCQKWNEWYDNKRNWYDYQYHPDHPEFQDDSGV